MVNQGRSGGFLDQSVSNFRCVGSVSIECTTFEVSQRRRHSFLDWVSIEYMVFAISRCQRYGFGDQSGLVEHLVSL